MIYATGIQTFIDRCNAAMPPDFYTLSLEKQRQLYCGLTKVFPYDLPSDVTIADETVNYQGKSFPFRLYRPKNIRGDGLLLYIRGGGFVVGSLETHNTVVAELCDKTGLVTIAPDFRLSPEYPFPAALEDCYAVLCGITENVSRFAIDPKCMVMCGDSSGANMAVSIAMMCRDRKGPRLCGQALISPVLNFTRWRQGGDDAPLLTGGEMEYYTACYAPEKDQVQHFYVSPLVSGSFHDLPPAYIMGAEMDSLLIDSQEYARKLREHNISVELIVEPGLVHSAVRARSLCPQVANAWERFCQRAAQFTIHKGDK